MAAKERAELRAAFDAEMRGELSLELPEGGHEEQVGPVYRSWGWAPRGFVASGDLSQLSGSQLGALIWEQIEFFGERSLAFEWKTYATIEQLTCPSGCGSRGSFPSCAKAW